MQDPSNNVVQRGGCREGMMATLVGQYPNACAEKALNERVQRPTQDSDWIVRDEFRLDECVEHVECANQTGKVSTDVVKSGDC